jgi:hypothetical protein
MLRWAEKAIFSAFGVVTDKTATGEFSTPFCSTAYICAIF